MIRTNKPRHRGGNKTDRVWARQKVRAMNVSAFEQLLEEIVADQLEERGAFTQAMKLRNRQEPWLPSKRSQALAGLVVTTAGR